MRTSTIGNNVNEDHLQQLVNSIHREKNAAFYMGKWFLRKSAIADKHPCKTAACIAGHACFLANAKPFFPNRSDSSTGRVIYRGNIRRAITVALEWLELEGDIRKEMRYLFLEGQYSKTDVLRELDYMVNHYGLDVNVPKINS